MLKIFTPNLALAIVLALDYTWLKWGGYSNPFYYFIYHLVLFRLLLQHLIQKEDCYESI